MTSLRETFTASRDNIGRLDDPSILREAATQVAELAASRGATHLVAASPYAERIVGAAMSMQVSFLCGGMFARPDNGLGGRTVLVVDVTLASGTSMAHAARRARRSGASRVDGVVLHMVAGAVGREECGVDELSVLDSWLPPTFH